MAKRPGNEFIIQDRSGQYTPVTENLVSPLQLMVSSFDKGPEDIREISGDDFYKLYGQDISYARHGQPAIQAANIINNGGRLCIKRIVADDATLANIILLAEVKSDQAPKIDLESGNQIYIDTDTGAETMEPKAADGTANQRAMVNVATIRYDVASIAGAKTLSDIQTACRALLVEKDPEIVSGGEGEVTPSIVSYTLDGEETDTIYGDTNSTESEVDNSENDSSVPGIVPLPIGKEGDETEEPDEPVFTEGTYIYPIYIFADNGRGASTKRIFIEPDYAVSKNLKFVLYKLNHPGTVGLDNEYIRFAATPETIYNGTNMSLTEAGKGMTQIVPATVDESLEKFINKVSEFSGIEVDDLEEYDFLFGKTKKGEELQQIAVDPEGYDLASEFGIQLANGTNGEFGNAPFGTEAWTKKAVEFFDGTFDEEIFDVEHHYIEAAVDANYPLEVKLALTKLVDFRKDFMYLRDIGLDVSTMEAIKLLTTNLPSNMYCVDYCQSYDIIDPFTHKQVPVTIGYSLSRLLISHLTESDRHKPFSGSLHNIEIPEAIDNTVSFIPRITPIVDQKQVIYDKHINYATYQNGMLTIETQINSQVDENQCSWLNNIFLVQDVIRSIRQLCPRIRYSFIDTASGLDTYASNVNDLLDRYRSKFKYLSFEWSADEVMLANHIFNATLVVSFKEYVDYEKFTIFVTD